MVSSACLGCLVAESLNAFGLRKSEHLPMPWILRYLIILYSKMRIISERICSHAASGLQEFLPLQIDQHSFAALSFSCKRNLVIILRVQELGENRGNKILYLEAFINVNQILAFLLGFQ